MGFPWGLVWVWMGGVWIFFVGPRTGSGEMGEGCFTLEHIRSPLRFWMGWLLFQPKTSGPKNTEGTGGLGAAKHPTLSTAPPFPRVDRSDRSDRFDRSADGAPRPAAPPAGETWRCQRSKERGSPNGAGAMILFFRFWRLLKFTTGNLGFACESCFCFVSGG